MVVTTYSNALRLIKALILCNLKSFVFYFHLHHLNIHDLFFDEVTADAFTSHLSFAARARQKGKGYLQSRPSMLDELQDTVSVEDMATAQLYTRLGS